MREKRIELYFRQQCEQKGALCLKFVSPGMSGVPDRIVISPDGTVRFAEIKTRGEKPRFLQAEVFKLFEARKNPVAVLDSKESVDRWIEREL